MSENGQIYTAGKKIYTAAGSDGMDKYHFCLISKIHSIILNIFMHPPLWVFSTSIKYLTLITPHPSHTWYENSCFPPKGFIKNIPNIDCFRIFVIIFCVCLFVRKLAKLVRCPYSSYPSPIIVCPCQWLTH